MVGTIVRRSEHSQAIQVCTGAKRAARPLFQTPKNQIKQKKMAPPPKKFEESEEEESSDLEESSGEEVIDLEMEFRRMHVLQKCQEDCGLHCNSTLINSRCSSLNWLKNKLDFIRPKQRGEN